MKILSMYEDFDLSLYQIICDACKDALNSIKACHLCEKHLFDYNFVKLKFRALVFSELYDKLEEKNYTFERVYSTFLEIYYGEGFENALHLLRLKNVKE